MFNHGLELHDPMTSGWLKHITVLSVLSALVFLRLMDLAVFDADHNHMEKAHVTVHAAEMAHSHYDGEATEHDTLGAISAHVGFHTLLSVFLDTSSDNMVPLADLSNRFGPHANQSAIAHQSRPPVPPPLA